MEFLILKLITFSLFLWASIHWSSFEPPLFEKAGTSSNRKLSGYRSSKKIVTVFFGITAGVY